MISKDMRSLKNFTRTQSREVQSHIIHADLNPRNRKMNNMPSLAAHDRTHTSAYVLCGCGCGRERGLAGVPVVIIVVSGHYCGEWSFLWGVSVPRVSSRLSPLSVSVSVLWLCLRPSLSLTLSPSCI
jgi:hypothetical protein